MTIRITALATAAVLSLSLPLPAASLDPNNPTGNNGLVLIDKLGHFARFVDPVTFKELASIELAVAPHDFALSPDHKTLYVPIYGDGVYGRNPHPGHTIAIIDLAARKLAGSIDVSPYQAPHGIQINGSGDRLFVTCDISRKLLVIDPKKRTIESAIDTEGTGHWVAVLPDASKAYVANKNDKPFVSVIDLKTRKMIGRVPAPNGTQGIVASPDGKYVVAVDNGSSSLIIIDTAVDTSFPIPLEGNPRGAFKPRFTPDGSKLVVCSLNQTVNIIDTADPHGKQTILTVGKDPMGFAISPDGKTLLVANHGDGTVSVINLQEGRAVSSFKGGTGIETLTYF